jgi:hypothetical protein
MRKLGIALVVVLAALLAPAQAQAVTGWRIVGSDNARPLDEGQGLATVTRGATTQYRYTGTTTIPLDLLLKGWNHVGDPGAAQGWYVEPYQRDDRGGKLFRVQSPSGTWSNYTHALESSEANNNSWSAVSPDTRWMVNGEWGTMDRLLVFPMPGVAATDPSKNLPLASSVRLDHQVRDVQGCDFVTATQLLCSSDDPAGTLFGTTKPLLQVDLSAPVGSGDVNGHVTSLGQLPLQSGCSGEFEVEGIDYFENDGTLRVVILSPGACIAIDSKTYRFRR